jgi:hypothetical protein
MIEMPLEVAHHPSWGDAGNLFLGTFSSTGELDREVNVPHVAEDGGRRP